MRGWGGCRCSRAGDQEGCAFPPAPQLAPRPGSGGRTPPQFLLQEPPSTLGPRQSGRHLHCCWGMPRAQPSDQHCRGAGRRCSGPARAWRAGQAQPVRAVLGSAPGPCAPQAGAVAAPPTPCQSRVVSLGAPSFMQCWLLRDRRLPMLNALILRDKTALEIPHCWPLTGARGLPGGRQPGAGGLLGSSQTPCPLSGFEPPAGASGVERTGVQAGSGGDWLGLARGLLQLELPCQSRLPQL